MILLDENQEIIHDEPDGVSDARRDACRLAGQAFTYAGPNILYYKEASGGISVVNTKRDQFEQVSLSAELLDAFRRTSRAADDNVVLREIDWSQSMVYTDTTAFYIPTEILK